MKTIKIDDPKHLIQEINQLPQHFIFRGQADKDWRLESSLERTLADNWTQENVEKHEKRSISNFKSKFHLYDSENTIPDSGFAWLSIMQHYGVPTRLLDFTESPYVALYFAIESYTGQKPRKPFALFALDYREIMKRSVDHIRSKDKEFDETQTSVFEKSDQIFDSVVNRFSYDVLWVAEPKVMNARLDRQSGTFLISGNRAVRIEAVLNSNLYSDIVAYKFEIDGSLYENIYALLRKMNINSKSIYGNLEGLARSIKMEMQVYSA